MFSRVFCIFSVNGLSEDVGDEAVEGVGDG